MTEPRRENEPRHEGEEAPPPGTRVMAVVRWGIVVTLALVAVASMLYYFDKLPRATARPSAARYFCPMHPQIVQDRPGDCPICGMSLVRDEGAKASGSEAAATPLAYACPLHPDFGSANPNDLCPVCGTRLERRPSPAGPPSASPAPASPPGLGPVQLDDARVQLIGMRTARATRERLASELRTVGFVSVDERGLAAIGARASGWIERLLVDETGQRVRRGQVLATIYSPELLAAQQELLAARRWTAERGAPGAPALDEDARRRLELLGVSSQEIGSVSAAGRPRTALELRSPVSGTVTQKYALAGQYVQAGATLFEVADLSRVWVLAEVYEHEVGRVRVGQPARFELAAYPGRTFAGTVRFVSPTLEAATRSLRVRVELPNRDQALRPGMYGSVALSLDPAQALAVPAEAVVDSGELQVVFVVRPGGRFEPRRVTAGARFGERVQILSGLAEGEEVVTTGNFFIDAESRLRAAIEGLGSAPGGTGAGDSAGAAAPGAAGAGDSAGGSTPAGSHAPGAGH